MIDKKLIVELIEHKVNQLGVELEAIEYLAKRYIEQKNKKKKRAFHGRTVHNRNRAVAHELLMNHYFAENPLCSEQAFRERFRMNKELFMRIVADVQNSDEYFVQKRDATHKRGFSAIQKVAVAVRLLSCGSIADIRDEYHDMGESTTIECLKRFCNAIITKYSAIYLRRPTQEDVNRLLEENRQRGFPGMLGSIGSMHWEWKNCPFVSQEGQYRIKEKQPMVVLEAMASKSLWIWYSSFGLPGSLKDLNGMKRLDVFSEIDNNCEPKVKFVLGQDEYNLGYYLADTMYPRYATFIKTIANPASQEEKFFAEKQEATRKDVEKAFSILQNRFQALKKPSQFWKIKDLLTNIIKTCIILHNLIVECGEEADLEMFLDKSFVVPSKSDNSFQELREMDRAISDHTAHDRLQGALVDHVWSHFANTLQ